MADDEDNDGRGRDKGRSHEPIKVPFDMPSRVDDGTAVAMFLLDLQRSGATWRRNPPRACHIAMLAAVRFLHAVGSPGLSQPFRVIGEGLADLRQGRYPPIFQAGPVTPSGAKPTAEWNLHVDVACFLEALIKGAGMKNADAAKELAKILDKNKVPIGRIETLTWKAVSKIREEIRRPSSEYPREARERFFFNVEGLLTDLQPIPVRDRQGHLLGVFRRALTEHEALVRQEPPE
jgi:hypothetical protein